MKAAVFLGPSLDLALAKQELDATFLPPARQGDVYRAARQKPDVIGIVDGNFERVLSIAHKEILWAMREGIHVYGAASMGALRAAELATYGMVGIGAVFRRFESEELEDDDEVAIAHASVDEGYRSLSVAMVDMRFTVEAAVGSGVIDDTTALELIRVAKSLFYPDRTYPAVLERVERNGSLASFRSFLSSGRVHQKRDDALELLRALKALASDPVAPKPIPPKKILYWFEHTDAFEELRKRATHVERVERK